MEFPEETIVSGDDIINVLQNPEATKKERDAALKQLRKALESLSSDLQLW